MDTQKRIIIWFSAALIVAIAGIGAYHVATGAPAEPPRKDGTMSIPLDESDWTKGSKTPKATFTEYSDFQCPACGSYYPMLEEMFAEYKDQISFTYRHFPLPQHKNALPAAYASEAAGKQGKFWEMADMLFKNQDEWSESVTAQIIFEGYAKKIELNIDQYKADVKSDAVKAKVERDLKSAKLSRVDHTPTFFINGKLSDNPRSAQELKALIDYAITHP
ncbi:MAG: protein-disulfide isomerase [Candidatus Yonathbacteria bacterium CG17_big_fil_post_rev_8_21_14_2_50_43_9]|nr:MAG: protein-disulfide isomerase [Candidatus Yonathbacteria bacterium CG17_big_fil_post_rev_8_21_14_2_50_43_9]